MKLTPLTVRERLIVALGTAFGLVLDSVIFDVKLDAVVAMALMLYCFYLIIFRRGELN